MNQLKKKWKTFDYINYSNFFYNMKKFYYWEKTQKKNERKWMKIKEKLIKNEENKS